MARRSRFGLVLGSILLFTSACTWSTVGYDASRSGFSPHDRKITPANVGSLTERWTAEVGEWASAPVVGSGRVFVTGLVGSAGGIHAYDATGTASCSGTDPNRCEPVWSVALSHSCGNPGISKPIFAEGLVWAGGASATLPARNACWFYEVGSGFHPETGEPADARVVTSRAAPAASSDGVIFGYRLIPVVGLVPRIDAWTVLSAKVVNGDSVDFSLPITGSAPAVADGKLYVIHDGSLNTYDARGEDFCGFQPFIGRTCIPIWSGTLSQAPGWDDMPAVANGLVYVPELNGNVDVFDADGCGGPTCSPLWSAHAGSMHLAPVAVTASTLFASSDDGHLYAFNANGCGAATCEPIWTGTGSGFLRAPSVAGSVLFAASTDGDLYAFNANGCGQATCEPLWSTDVGAGINSAPVISDGRVFVTDTVGTLHAYGLS